MKNQIFTLVFCLAFGSMAMAQSCSTFYPFEQGTTFQITNYGKNDKVAAISDFEITDVTSDEATFNSILKDKNGEVLSDGQFKIRCTGEGISMDVKSLLSPEMFEQFDDFETDISGTNIILPNELAVGQELPDATMNMKVNMAGINMNMEVSLTDRKVQGQESVTTPAGTFDCYVITYTSKVKMGMNRVGTAKQWIAKGVGLVKQEDYNRRGKVTSSSLLTAFSN